MFDPNDQAAKNPAFIKTKSQEERFLIPNPMDELKVGDTIGAFSGYLRRPKSTAAGLMAYFFGENGADADVISALHLTHYQELPAKVSVWMVKDKNGKLKKAGGSYPLLAQFIASIRRPIPSMSGQTAQFFGANGVNADTISVLNKSEYLDALVYVEIQLAAEGGTVDQIQTPIPQQEMTQEENRLVPAEERAIKKQQKYAEEAQKLLVLSGFYKNLSVLSVLGTDFEYQAWLEKQTCCHPGTSPCSKRDIESFPIPEATRQKYRFIPLCGTHRQQWVEGKVEGVLNPINFLQSRQAHLVQAWAKEVLRRELGVPEGYEASPSKLYAWAVDRKLQSAIPPAFLGFLNL